MIKKLEYETIKSSRPTLDEVRKMKKFPVSVVLENIRSLYNVGSIFRTSDGAFVERLYLCGYTGYPPRKEIDKTALGSVESVNWKRVEDTACAVEECRSAGYQIVSLEHTDRSRPYNKVEYKFPVCLIVGNEVEGVSSGLVESSHMAIDIPMYGIKQSLNVAVAYGIVVFHMIDEYLKKNEGSRKKSNRYS
jgi:tRNA G18 (ribose-2'-O)-methylase SpoU